MTALPPDLIDEPAKRENIPKPLRWKIYARDGFACRYCGLKPPDAVLQIDHVKAVVRGGTNDEENLVTACQDCNYSKGPKEIPPPVKRSQETFVVPLENVPKVAAITAELTSFTSRLYEYLAKETKTFQENGHDVEVPMALMMMGTLDVAAWLYFRFNGSSKTKRDFISMCANAFDEHKEKACPK